MDIDDIRRANIMALEEIAGSPTQAAARVSMSGSQYTNLRDGAFDPRSGKKRGMRKETAWRFEDAFNKPRGWLDIGHPEIPTTAPEARTNYDPEEAALLAALRALPPVERQRLLIEARYRAEIAALDAPLPKAPRAA